MPRYAVLRLLTTRRILAKDGPCAFVLEPADPLADAQLRMLAVATPWNPVMMEATDPVWDGRAFVADVTSIESQPRPPPMPKSRRVQRLVRRNPRFIGADSRESCSRGGPPSARC